VKGVVDPFVAGLGTARLPEVDHPAVVPSHGGGEPHVGGKGRSDGRPAVGDVLPAQGEPDGLQDMVGKDGDEQVPVGAVLFLVVDGT